MQRDQNVATYFLLPVDEYKQSEFIDYTNNDFYVLEDEPVKFWETYCRQVAIHDGSLPNLGERLPERHHLILPIELAFSGTPSASQFDDLLVQIVKITQELISKQCAPGPGQLSCLVLAAEAPRDESVALVMPVRLHFPFVGIAREERRQLAEDLAFKLSKNVELKRVAGNHLVCTWREMVVGERSIDTKSERRYTPSERRDVPSERHGVTSERHGVTSERRDVPSERRDVPSERRDVPSERHGVSERQTIEERTEDKQLFLPLYGAGKTPLFLRHFWGDLRTSLSLSPPQEDLEQLHPACDVLHPLHEFIPGGPAETWLPLITSARFGRTPIARPTHAPRGPVAPVLPPAEADERMLARYFVYHLSPTRFTTRHYWRDVGQALQRAFHGDAEGLELFKTHSARYGAFDSEACAAWYATRLRIPITYRTLAWYARKDSPAAYAEWHDGWVMHAIDKVMRFRGPMKEANSSMAEAIYRCFWLDHICIMRDKGVPATYYFNNNRWVKQNNGDVLRRDIRFSFPRYLTILQARLKVRESQSQDAEERDALKTRCKLLDMMQTTLEPRGVRGLLYGDLIENFNEAHRDFAKYENCHQDMYACGGGVLHCIRGTGEVLFREGKPEDYITVGTDTPYHPEWTLETPAVRKYIKMRTQVFPDQEVNHHMHKVRARELISGNTEKKGYYHIGPTGGNSKTTSAGIDALTHGEYAKESPQTPFNIHWDDLKPSPFFIEAMDSKTLNISEISRDLISPAQFKRHTGNDPIRSRYFFDNGGTKVPGYVLNFYGNVYPMYFAPDDSTRERSVFVPYRSRWVHPDEAPATEEEQMRLRIFPTRPDFESERQELAEAGLWYRVHYFPIYAKEGIERLPRALVEEKEKYWHEYDAMEVFKRQVLAADETLSVSAVELHDVYTRWYQKMYPKFPMPSFPMFKADMSRRLGPTDGSDLWQGWVITSDKYSSGAGF